MKDLTTFTLSLLQELENEGRFGTAHVYRSTLKAFTAYWQEHHPQTVIPLKAGFTVATLKEFEHHLQERMLKLNTISTYMRMLRAIYYRALKQGYVIYVPGLFDYVYTGTRTDVKRALPPIEMKQVLDSSSIDNHSLEEAQVWFALLFVLRGMPFVDLAKLRKCDLKDNTITYRRQKTGQLLTVRLTPEASKLIQSCADHNPDSPYLLGILWKADEQVHPTYGSMQEYCHYQNALRTFNRNLKKLACVLKIDSPLSSYTARHTWATIAFHRNFATGIISTALGHSSTKITETYLKPFEADELDKMNKAIIHYTEKCNQLS